MEKHELIQLVRNAISDIANGTKTPKESGIIKMLAQLREQDMEAWLELMAEYKPVSAIDSKKRYGRVRTFTQDQVEQRRLEIAKRMEDEDIAAEVDREIAEIDFSEPLEGMDDDDQEYNKKRKIPSKRKLTEEQNIALNNRKNRIKYIPEKQEIPDQAKYVMNGQEYGKGPLVLAIVQHICRDNPDMTYNKIKQIFPDSILPGYGVIAKYEAAVEKTKGGRARFFLKYTIVLIDCTIVVCNQITGKHVNAIIPIATSNGLVIK